LSMYSPSIDIGCIIRQSVSILSVNTHSKLLGFVNGLQR
jgi:hypothetical protein